jgi:hypothetical protein
MREEVSFQLMGGPTDVIKVFTTDHTHTVHEIRIDILFRVEGDMEWYGFQGYIAATWEGHSHSGAAIRCNLARVWGYINTRHRAGWLQFI